MLLKQFKNTLKMMENIKTVVNLIMNAKKICDEDYPSIVQIKRIPSYQKVFLLRIVEILKPGKVRKQPMKILNEFVPRFYTIRVVYNQVKYRLGCLPGRTFQVIIKFSDLGLNTTDSPLNALKNQ